jgi:DNA-binding PadR family transcriptional regulator
MYAPRKQKMFKLMSLFSQNNELYQSGLEKKLEISYRNTIRLLQPLEKEKLIEYRFEPSEKQGPGRKVWKLTSEGLIYALILKENWKDRESLRKVANAHSDKLLVFKKWSLFEQAGLESFMESRLAQVIHDLKVTLRLTSDLKTPHSPSFYTSTTDKLVFYAALSMPSPFQSRVQKVFKQDPELRKYVNYSIYIQEASLRKRLSKLKKVLKSWLQLEK